MFKKALFLFGIITFFLPGVAFASAERVESFVASYEIQKDASVLAVETIKYDFGTGQRHGIYRTIPIKYKTEKGNRYIKIEDIAVTDESSNPINFSKSRSGNDLKIKIGDADKYVSGVKIYKLNYRIVGAMNYFSDHDEFYWNVTGNEWEIPIDSATATITYPPGSQKESSKITCYQGVSGSNQACLSSKIEGRDGETIASVTADNLSISEGLTFAAWFPKGLVEVKKPLMDSRILLYILAGFIMLAGPIIAFAVMLRKWLQSGRDPKGSGAIVPEFTPPKGVTPTEAGALQKDAIEKKSLSALLIYLATRGYLKINRINKKGIFGGHDYEIEFLKVIDDKVAEADRQIIDELFGGQKKYILSDLKKDKAEEISKIWKTYVKNTFDIMTQKGVYNISPDKVLKKYLGISGGFGSAALIGFFFLGSWFVPVSISLGLVAAIVGGFGLIMPAKTVEGAAMKDKVLGLKEYMNVAEKDRMKILNAPKLNPQQFEALLPFAIALGVEKEWAKQFEGILTESPGWYNDPSNTTFNVIVLNSFLDDMHGTTSAAFAAGASAAAGGSSGFGGGGFSGGGFGGGGGGSW